MSSAIFQATTEEHFRLVARLYAEYFEWVAERFKETYDLDIRQGVSSAHEQFMAGKDDLMPPRGRLLLVEDERELAGTGALKPLDEETGYVKRMYVRPAHRGRGLSRVVIERLIADARAIGYRQLVLETARFMTTAQQLYRSAGFRDREPFEGTEIPAEFHRHTIFMGLDL